jgi:hypothetical protein
MLRSVTGVLLWVVPWSCCHSGAASCRSAAASNGGGCVSWILRLSLALLLEVEVKRVMRAVLFLSLTKRSPDRN